VAQPWLLNTSTREKSPTISLNAMDRITCGPELDASATVMPENSWRNGEHSGELALEQNPGQLGHNWEAKISPLCLVRDAKRMHVEATLQRETVEFCFLNFIRIVETIRP
jgi:hypothetical protein